MASISRTVIKLRENQLEALSTIGVVAVDKPNAQEYRITFQAYDSGTEHSEDWTSSRYWKDQYVNFVRNFGNLPALVATTSPDATANPAAQVFADGATSTEEVATTMDEVHLSL